MALTLALFGAVSPGALAQQTKADAQVQTEISRCTAGGESQEVCAKQVAERCSEQGNYTTVAVVDCESAMARYWDRELNRVYSLLMDRIDGPLKDSVRQAQRTWIKWRDQRCNAWGYMDGTMYRMVGAGCFTETVRQRVADLNELLEAL